MAVVCWSVKGGSGTTVVAGALALVLAAGRPGDEPPVLAVDLGGDLPSALGVPEPGGPGLWQWLTADPAPSPGSLTRLAATAVGDALAVVPAGPPATRPAHWERLAEELDALPGPVVIDAGCRVPPVELLEAADVSLLVVRPCYLALRRAVAVASAATAVAVVREPGRALGPSDVRRILGVPAIIEIPCDPSIARAVDAGLLASRVPGALGRALREVA